MCKGSALEAGIPSDEGDHDNETFKSHSTERMARSTGPHTWAKASRIVTITDFSKGRQSVV